MKGLTEATMLYRKGTQERLHGVHVNTIIVDAHQVDEHLEAGWYRSPAEVSAAEAARAAREAAKEAAKLAKKGAGGADSDPGNKPPPDA